MQACEGEPPWVTGLFLKDWACLQEHSGDPGWRQICICWEPLYREDSGKRDLWAMPLSPAVT